MKNLSILIVISALILGCKDDEPEYFREITYGFIDNLEGWTVKYSDYPVGEEEFYELESGLAKLPAPLDTTLSAVMISGNNHSDDLFSYMYKPLTGLAPNTTYNVSFILNLATNVATGSFGAGGSPDLSIGVGGLDTVPSSYVDEENMYRPAFDVELQSHRSNEVMQVVGTLGATDTTTVYTQIQRHNLNKPMKLKTDSSGTLYLMVGWDSGFEGITRIYIKTIVVRIEY